MNSLSCVKQVFAKLCTNVGQLFSQRVTVRTQMSAALEVDAFLRRSVAIPESRGQIHPLSFKELSQFTTFDHFSGIKTGQNYH